jgi:aspartate/methionine/tyrosine aminotransferase
LDDDELFGDSTTMNTGRSMNFNRMLIEKESPEEIGYGNIKYNLTESSVRDMDLSAIPMDFGKITLAYTDHKGKPELRDLIARDYPGFTRDNILITTGACLGLFIVNATLLLPGEHILVMQPNYATNIEVPRSLGITVDLLSVKFEDRFELSLDKIKAKLTPKTKVISITTPHNPTGTIIPESCIDALIEIVKERKIYLLVDETYRGLNMGTPIASAAVKHERVICVESMSKSLGMPGIRVGWIATKNMPLKERFLATKEQICICGSIVDEEIAYHALKMKDHLFKPIAEKNQKHFQIMKNWLNNHPILEWIEPKGGVVAFPRIKPTANVDIPKFYKILNDTHGTFVGPGHWFECEDRHFRIGYGWPTTEELEGGLAAIDAALKLSGPFFSHGF